MSRKALVILADGVEEMEAVIVIDVLRRAGVLVTVGGLTGPGVVTCSRQLVIKPDCDLGSAIRNGPYDAVIMPGGLQNANSLAKSESVRDILRDQEKANRVIGAICAAPLALKAHGISTGKNLTSYPAFQDKMEGYHYSEATVVEDDNLITSRGPGTAFEFALTLVEKLCGSEKRSEVAGPMLLK